MGEFWGASKLTVEDISAAVVFGRHAPYISNVESKLETGEKTAKVAVTIVNQEPFSMIVETHIVLDRDKNKPFDFTEKSDGQTIKARAAETFTFDYEPEEPSLYRTYSYVTIAGNIVTDQTDWIDSFSIPGKITAKVKDASVKNVDSVIIALFDTNYAWIGNKVVDAAGKATWTGLTQTRYIMEVYKEPSTNEFFKEFWGATSLPLSGRNFDFEKISPSFVDLKVHPLKPKPHQEFEVGIDIRNLEETSRSTKVTILLDRDRNSPFDITGISEPKSLNNEKKTFTFSLRAEEAEGYSIYVVVQSLYGSSFLVTGQEGWRELLTAS